MGGCLLIFDEKRALEKTNRFNCVVEAGVIYNVEDDVVCGAEYCQGDKKQVHESASLTTRIISCDFL